MDKGLIWYGLASCQKLTAWGWGEYVLPVRSILESWKCLELCEFSDSIKLSEFLINWYL